MAGMFGTGSGTTSVSQNIGVLAVTKVIPKFLGSSHSLLYSVIQFILGPAYEEFG